ncbi:unnamed protein product, partial [Symbiodinium microadriaticum]
MIIIAIVIVFTGADFFDRGLMLRGSADGKLVHGLETVLRARDIAISPGNYGPRPLRSESFPDGLQGLQDHDEARVRQAHELYNFVSQVCNRCQEQHLSWAVENPFSSLFWRTSFWKAAHLGCAPKYVHFHACMYGGERKKFTTIAFQGMLRLETLHKECDNSHSHKPRGWSDEEGAFSTSVEAAYPTQFCRQVARALRDACEANGFVMCPKDMLEASHMPLTADKVSRAMAAEGTTKSNLPNFVPEYGVTLRAIIPKTSCTWNLKEFIQYPVVTPQVTIPAGSRLLEISQRTRGEDGSVPAEADAICTFGVPWTPEEFVREAAQRGHPADLISAVPEPLKSTVWELAARDPSEVAEKRASFFRKWMKVASELHEEEKMLKDSMDEKFRSLVKNKKILLFERRYSPATVHESELDALAPVIKDAALSKAR